MTTKPVCNTPLQAPGEYSKEIHRLRCAYGIITEDARALQATIVHSIEANTLPANYATLRAQMRALNHDTIPSLLDLLRHHMPEAQVYSANLLLMCAYVDIGFARHRSLQEHCAKVVRSALQSNLASQRYTLSLINVFGGHESLVDHVEGCLASAEREIAILAAAALVQMAEDKALWRRSDWEVPSGAVNILRSVLRTRQATAENFAALGALLSLGLDSETATRLLVEHLITAETDAERYSILLQFRMSDGLADHSKAYRGFLESTEVDIKVRAFGMSMLGMAARKSAECAIVLAEALESRESEVQLGAMTAIRAGEVFLPTLAPFVLAAAESDDVRVRKEAFITLAEMGESARAVVPQLLAEALTERNSGI